jgi:hypothetical protein
MRSVADGEMVKRADINADFLDRDRSRPALGAAGIGDAIGAQTLGLPL